MALSFVLLLVLALLALWLWGPREPAVTDVTFDETRLDGGVAAHFAASEAAIADLRPDAEKRVVWAGAEEARTEWAVLYVHGFSASSEEIRPVPDQVAEALGANLIYTRLAGHGRSGPAMAEATVAAWMADMAEGLAAARRLGEKVVVMGCSTGCTLTTLALHEEMARGGDRRGSGLAELPAQGWPCRAAHLARGALVVAAGGGGGTRVRAAWAAPRRRLDHTLSHRGAAADGGGGESGECPGA